MELTKEQIDLANKMKILIVQIDEIYNEIDSIQWRFHDQDELDEYQLINLCERLESKAFPLEMQMKIFIEDLNFLGITEQSHPSIFPKNKFVTPPNESKNDLIDDLPF